MRPTRYRLGMRRDRGKRGSLESGSRDRDPASGDRTGSLTQGQAPGIAFRDRKRSSGDTRRWWRDKVSRDSSTERGAAKADIRCTRG